MSRDRTLYHAPQVKPACSFTADEVDYLTKRIQDGGTEVVQVQFVAIYTYSTLQLNPTR